MAILLFLFWLILNGKITLEIVLVGAAVSAAVTFAAYRLLGFSLRKELRFWRRLPGILLYLFYLVGQIFVSNFLVIRLILKRDNRRSKLVWFRPGLRGETARVALANSITLTPGTVTVGLTEDVICVHALRPELAQGIEECGFVKKLRRLEGEDHD